MKKIFLLIAFAFFYFFADAQYIFKTDALPNQISILKYASLADAGHVNYTLKQAQQATGLTFKTLNGNFSNLGFTDHNYWVKFSLKNATNVPVLYYLQTAEPVTDNVILYDIDNFGHTFIQQSGDNLDFSKRALPYKKTIFKIQLEPSAQKQYWMEIKNDGEKNSLPLELISPEKLLENTYSEQLTMGLFYGVLFAIVVTYFFFYFALNEVSFLYYSLYVSFAGICQFALDGYYHQYVGQSNSWINLHAVIISAILGSYFFGKYSELVLQVKTDHTLIHKAFKILYFFLAILLIGVIISPGFLVYAYPAINVLTLAGMILIFGCVGITIFRKQPIDLFYTSGIFILFFTILIAILMNFGVFPESFSTENITKPGIGLEIVALSLSMANRIRLLKSKKEELQEIALQKSEEMNDVKSYFLSNMSHELRTPLNAILGLTNIIEAETTDAKIKSSCEIIQSASYGLISSVNDILDFSMIEKGELKLAKSDFKLHEILQKLNINIGRQAKDKGLEFVFSSTVKSDMIITGDSIRLEQIIYNILNNAIKFTNEGKVSFQINYKLENDKILLLLTISDTGIGIQKEKLKSVFELFSQTSLSHKRKFGGFGIGLSITKVLVDLHYGKISLKSEPEIGTECEITLSFPYSIEQKVIETKVSDDYDLFGKHVLVVEDNPMNQMVMKMMLKRWQNTVVSFASDGAESLEALKEKNIDIVLMDLQMPVLDGYEAIVAIRNGVAGAQNINIPIIVLTADVTNDTKERVFTIGANDYLTKPVDPKLLYQKTTSLFTLQNVV